MKIPTLKFEEPIYVTDSVNNTIRKVTPSGVVTTLAGLAQRDSNFTRIAGSTDGTGSAARFNFPAGVAVDIAGNIYVADSGNYTIRKVTPGGVVTTLAGLAGKFGSTDGTGNAARFDGPVGVAVDNAGNIYVADSGNYTIRKVTPAGVVTTLAGLAGKRGSTDGTGNSARFDHPWGVAVDNGGNIYVADTGNDTIRLVTPSGVVMTLAGLTQCCNSFGSSIGGSTDGTGNVARFDGPFGLTVDSAGNVYVADKLNNTIRVGFFEARQAVIVHQPQSQILLAGSNATFGVTAVSITPLAYQWTKNGVNIIGATNATYELSNVQKTDAGSYRVVVSNAQSSVTSGEAILSVVAPTQNQTALQQGAVTLNVTAASAASLSYQWQKDGVNIAGATKASYTITGVQATNAGTYTVLVTGPDGASSQISTSATLAVVPAVHKLPVGYWPGVPFTVEIQCAPGAGTISYTLTESFSVSFSGLSVIEINEDGIYNPTTRVLKWGPFFDNSARVLRYTAVEYDGDMSQIGLNSTLSENGKSTALPGQVISLLPLHPADNSPPANKVITIGEMAAYATAWRRSQLWPVRPARIPDDYLTQAGVIWKRGEYYENVGGTPPLNWQPAPLPKGFKQAQFAADSAARIAKSARVGLSAASGTAVRTLTSAEINPAGPFDVTLTVTPKADVVVLALEEQLPPGWTADNINSGGLIDPNFNKIKWGPVFLNQSTTPRTYTYRAVPSAGARGAVKLSGLAAFDGTVINIGGATAVTLIGAPIPPRIAGIELTGAGKIKLTVEAEGLAPAALTVESTESILGPVSWTPEADSLITAGAQGKLEAQLPLRGNTRFYRIRSP